MKDFRHLHLHTIFSPLDGVAKPEEYIDKCIEYGMDTITITDHGTFAGIPDAYFYAKDKNIKTIGGVEFYYCDYHDVKEKLDEHKITLSKFKQKSPELSERYRRNRHLVVLSKDMIGWKNLLKISRVAWDKYFYYKPRINFNLLKDNKEGLIILSGCLNGPICHELRWAAEASKADKEREWLKDPKYYIDKARSYIRKFEKTFGDDFYLEFQILDTSIPYALETYAALYKLWKDEFQHIRPVLTNDVHYINKEDFEIQLIMMAVSQNLTIDDPNLFHTNTDEQYFKTADEILNSWREFGYDAFMEKSDVILMLQNTKLVTDKCAGFEPDLSPKLPEFENADQLLRNKTYARLRKLGLDKVNKKFYVDGKEVTYQEQLEIELDRIINKGFSSYFLIVADVLEHYVDLGYEKGPGRGSAAGSLVCYLLSITEIDSLAAGLSFDRFLSVSRGGYALNTTME